MDSRKETCEELVELGEAIDETLKETEQTDFDEDYDEYEIEGPYGGAFADWNDYYRWKEGF